MIRTAVLDDYQHVAKGLADWTPVTSRASVDFFHDHLADAAHIGYVSRSVYETFYRDTVSNITSWLDARG